MTRVCPIIRATAFARLPDAHRHAGPPSPWAEMTRPGQQMHSFLEGAFIDDDGALWLSDVPYGRVFRVMPDGNWQLMHHDVGEPHAMRIAADGRKIAVDYSRGLVELTGLNASKVLTNGPPATPFLGLSDMTFAPDGALWFTDSGRTSLSDPRGRVWRRAADGGLRLVLDCVPYPNGISLSPDGAWVYVAATRANAVWRFSSRLPAAGPPMVGTFLHLSGGLGPDGLACNVDGWVAVAQAQAGRAYVFDSLGDVIAEVRLPEGMWTTSVAFHPARPRELYIVEAQHAAVFVADIPEPRDDR